MTTNGFLRKRRQGERNAYEGRLLTLKLDLAVRLIANGDRRSDNAPDFIIVTSNAAGSDVPIGSAWRRMARSTDHQGSEFLSLTIDDPDFERPLNVAAYQSGQPDLLDIVWRRRGQRRAAPDQSAETPQT